MQNNYPTSKLQQFDKFCFKKGEHEGMGLYICIYSNIVEHSPAAFDWDNQNFKDYCKDNRITQKGTRTIKKQHNHFWFNATDSSQGKAYGFLYHIRNAFAHGRIKVITEGKERYYVLYDTTKTRKGKIIQTMSGHIKCEFLWDMIELLLLTHKP